MRSWWPAGNFKPISQAQFGVTAFTRGRPLAKMLAFDHWSVRARDFEPVHERSALESALSSNSVELSQLWQWLVAGEVTFEAGFGARNRCFAILGRARAPSAPRVLGMSREILERIIEGACPQNLAEEFSMAVSTLSSRCATVLTAIGAGAWPSRVPGLLVLAVHAARGTALGKARVDGFCCDGVGRWVVSAPNPVNALRSVLTDSEYHVAGLAIDGKSHAEIAGIRNASPRTVANQLATIFRKLGVSGRAALRSKAVLEYARAPELARQETSGP